MGQCKAPSNSDHQGPPIESPGLDESPQALEIPSDERSTHVLSQALEQSAFGSWLASALLESYRPGEALPEDVWRSISTLCCTSAELAHKVLGAMRGKGWEPFYGADPGFGAEALTQAILLAHSRDQSAITDSDLHFVLRRVAERLGERSLLDEAIPPQMSSEYEATGEGQ